MGVSEIGFPQNVVYKQRIQTSDTLPVTIGASKYCEFLFDIDAGDRMTPLGIVGWGCNDKTQVFLLDFCLDNDLQTAKLILKNPYATTIAINSLYIDVLYSKQGLDMSEVDVVDNLTTDSAIAALSAKQGKVLDEKIDAVKNTSSSNYCKMPDGTLIQWVSAEITSGWTRQFSFSQSFKDTNYEIATCLSINSTEDMQITAVSKAVNYVALSWKYQPSSAVPLFCSVIAIGRWK